MARQLCSCVDLQAVGALGFFGELYSLAKGFGPFLRELGQALEKGRVLFLVTTSTSPSLQAYTELHALSPLRGSISPWCNIMAFRVIEVLETP